MPRTFYHLVKNNPPTPDDFLSYVEQGITLKIDTPEARRLAEGVSACATLRQARNRARLPSLRDHAYIAELHIPDGAPITVERTGRIPGHHTLWGSPAGLLGCVVSVVRVDAVD